MMRPFWLALAGIAAVNSAALAALPGGMTISADRRIVTMPNSGPATHAAPRVQAAKRTVIFDNLARLDPLGVYMAGTGYTIGGPDSVVGQIWVAASFVPAATATVTEVQAALGFIEGTKQSVLISIYADAGGVPGTALWSAKVKLPAFGDCCAVATARNAAGLPVVAGTQYWLVVTTLAGGADSFDAWAFNVADQVHAGQTAVDTGAGWMASPSLPDLAFAVLGD